MLGPPSFVKMQQQHDHIGTVSLRCSSIQKIGIYIIHRTMSPHHALVFFIAVCPYAYRAEPSVSESLSRAADSNKVSLSLSILFLSHIFVQCHCLGPARILVKIISMPMTAGKARKN